MQGWQIILLVFFVALPVVLMLDFWPHDDRLTSRGRPLPRPWRRQIEPPEPADEHH